MAASSGGIVVDDSSVSLLPGSVKRNETKKRAAGLSGGADAFHAIEFHQGPDLPGRGEGLHRNHLPGVLLFCREEIPIYSDVPSDHQGCLTPCRDRSKGQKMLKKAQNIR